MSEPTPTRPHTEEYERGEERALMYVNAEGIVQCSAELMRDLLEQAGWERVQPPAPPWYEPLPDPVVPTNG